jgi:hypothetical protein
MPKTRQEIGLWLLLAIGLLCFAVGRGGPYEASVFDSKPTVRAEK